MQTSRSKIHVPAGTDAISAEFVAKAMKAGSVRDRALVKIRDQYAGGDAALSSEYHPLPAGCASEDWREYRKLLTHVNFVRPAVRTWIASVYGGRVARNCVSNPYQEHISNYISGIDYDRGIRGWIENAILYGTAVAVPVLSFNGGAEQLGLDENAELSLWLPNPVHTYVYTSPTNVNDIEAIVEVLPGRVMFVTKRGTGWATKTGGQFTPAAYDKIPAIVARGKDMTHMGEVYGESLVGDAAEWSIRCTALALNISILQKLQTRATFIIYTDADDAVMQGKDFSPSKFLQLAKDAKAEFLTPQPHINECLSIMKSFIGLLSVASSIPADVLDSTLAESTSSAEAARIRAIPLLQQSGNMLAYWRHLEQVLIQTMTAVLEMAATRNYVSMRSLAKQVITEITIKPDVIPTAANEKATTLIALHGAGLISDTAAIQEANDNSLAEEEVHRMADLLVERRKVQTAQQIADAAQKSGSVSG